MYFIKTFNDDFAGPYGVPETVDIPDPPPFSEESAQRGRKVYEENQCYDCHGNAGRGDGSSAPTLETQWGRHIRPADMTKRWTFVGGTSRQDIYRTFTTGMDGSPMPSYDIPPEDRWALVDYVYSLSRDEPNYSSLVIAEGRTEALDIERGSDLFDTAETAYFPVVGQVIEPGREFSPATDGIEVKAVYNEEEIAVMLSWHTMTPDTSGVNSPTLEVPPLAERDTLHTVPAETETPAPEYSDAVAVQVPSDTLEGNVKPYFLFGDSDHPVDIWFADLAATGPEFFVGEGSENIQAGDQDLSFYSDYDEGRWTVIFKRGRATAGGSAFEEGAFMPIAFSVWDGFNRERGNRRGITSWYSLYLAPIERQSAAVPMAGYGLATLLLELGLIYAVRRKYGQENVEAS
jgi:mono/diheme cytochrome c family protein